jgi:hypothetical protein
VKTLDTNLDRYRKSTSGALIAMVALFSLCGCSESPTEPADTGSPALAVTITSSSVSTGEVVGLTFTPTHPCWDEAAEMEAVVSWDAAHFVWLDAPRAVVEHRGEGRVLVREADRDGFASGMNLAFRALADGSTAGFVVEQVTLRCERGTRVDLRNPPLLAATHP